MTSGPTNGRLALCVLAFADSCRRVLRWRGSRCGSRRVPRAPPQRSGQRPVRHRQLQAGAKVTAVLTTPLGVLSVLFWANTLNPMMSAFLEDFHLENATGQVVQTTLLGRIGDQPDLHVLPQYQSVRPTLPARPGIRRPLEPGQRLHLIYDADDLNLAVILIEAVGQPARELRVENDSGVTKATLRDLDVLSLASPETIELVNRNRAAFWQALAQFGGIAPALSTVVWLVLRRRAGRRRALVHG